MPELMDLVHLVLVELRVGADSRAAMEGPGFGAIVSKGNAFFFRRHTLHNHVVRGVNLVNLVKPRGFYVPSCKPREPRGNLVKDGENSGKKADFPRFFTGKIHPF